MHAFSGLAWAVLFLFTCVANVESSGTGDEGSNAGGKEIAVIGGGSAGAMTVLELIRRKEVSKVTLYEQADRIGHPKSASGIIAALLITDPAAEYWNKLDDVDDVTEKAQWWHVDKKADYTRLVKFAQRAAMNKLKKDFRAQKPNQRNFFIEGGKIVKELVNWKPELCEAIVGPFCCVPGSAPRKWMDDNKHRIKQDCDWLHGVAHIFYTKDDFHLASNEEKAKKGHWDVWRPKSDGLNILDDYIGMNLTGAVWQPHHEGFVRVENLFPILTKIFKDSGKVDLAFNCHVDALKPLQGERVGVTTNSAKSPDCKFDARDFDRVIVAAGAASVPIMQDVDQALPWQMVPVKGFAIANANDHILEENRMIGIEFEEPGQYIRAEEEGGVRYGFGRIIGTFEDELLEPEFRDWDTKFGPKLTGLGRKMLEMEDTKKLAGMRPVSCLGNFPLVKAFTGAWSGVLLNTGFGFYGYGLTWLSARLVVDTAIHGQPQDPQWREAVEYTTGECPIWMPTCWPGWFYFTFIALVAATGLYLMYMLVKSCCGSKAPKVAGTGADYTQVGQEPQKPT